MDAQTPEGPSLVVVAPGLMVPVEPTAPLRDQVQAVLYNIERFNLSMFEVWLRGSPGALVKLATKRPPDRLYRLVTDNERDGEGVPLLYGFAVGYREGQHGGPALVMIQVLGVDTGMGSAADPVGVPAESLLDVTERAAAGKLVLDGVRAET